jgi:hypothetical protein
LMRHAGARAEGEGSSDRAAHERRECTDPRRALPRQLGN